LLICAPSLTRGATVFTNDATIAATNLSYEGDDIVVDGATLTVDGSHSFGLFLLTNSATLVHSVGATGLWITATTMTVENASTINISALGKTQVGSGYSAGSHGGRGYAYSGASDATHGDLRGPVDLGSGGYGGHRGGGRIRLTVGTLDLDGQILANGANGSTSYRGGGSGGSVWVEAGTLTGNGSISANAGSCTYYSGTGGGGGRIAVYYDDASGFDLSNDVHCTGGNGYNGVYEGGAGTICLKDNAEPVGLVRIDNETIGTSGATEMLVSLVEDLILNGARVSFSTGVTASAVSATNAVVTQNGVWSITNFSATGGSWAQNGS